MNKILILGSVNSPHLENFIKVILLSKKNYNITILNVSNDKNIKVERSNYYLNQGINILNCKSSKWNNKYYKITENLIHYLKGLKKDINKYGRYDCCLIHFIDYQSVIITNIMMKKIGKIIPVAYGSDILRNKRLSNYLYNRFFDNSYKIVVPNINSQKVLDKETNEKFSEKIEVIQFPQTIIESMLETKKNVSLDKVRKQFKLPNDKLIVICGHTATEAEQYEKMIAELNKCPIEILDRCFFIFMMTYAPSEYKSYQEKIDNILKNTHLKYVVFKEYIPYSEMLKLHFISDIHITTIKTDALSCFLQEELFAGATLIYGKWLKYYELESGKFHVHSIENFEDLEDTFINIVDNIEIMREKNHINKDGIYSLKGKEEIVKQWDINILCKIDSQNK